MNKTIGSRFKYISTKYKDNTAVIWDHQSVTYGELSKKINVLSGNILSCGMKKGDIVGVQCKEKINWIVSILSLVNVGMTYVPLEPNNSSKYIKQLCDNVNIKLILTDDDVNFSFVKTKNILSIDNIESDYFIEDTESDLLAYIMFTSGTTGMPKGVGVTHNNILNLTIDSNYVKLNSHVRMLQTGAPTFDASTFDVWGTLLNGGTLILIENKKITDFKYLQRIVHENEITTMWLTSPLFSIVAEKKPELFNGVKEIIVGGDIVNPDHVDKVLDVCDDIVVFNGYGPTECTTFSTVYKMTSKNNGKDIPIGKPIKNVVTFILDEHLKPVNSGEIGELYIGGKGVSKGYINNEKLNKERFIKNPFGEGRLYKTGDLVREDSSKNICFLGRKDRQVKIRGYRIELDAIEVLLKKIDFIDKAATCSITNAEGRKEICCCITLKEKKDATVELIRKSFAEIAPSHIILSQIKVIDDLPINKNGKIDYKQIKNFFEIDPIDEEDTVGEDKVEFETDELNLIAQIIKDRTGFKIDDATVSFFELGVDSLMAVYLADDISKRLEVEITAMDILTNATVKELLDFIKLQPKKEENEEICPKEIYLQEKIPILNQQKPIFIDFTVNPYSVKYNVPVLVELSSEVDIDLLVESLYKLVKRHDGLKVKFSMDGIDVFQNIDKQFKFEVEKLSGEPDLKNLIRPFNLKEEYPFRFSIIIDHNRRWLFMDFHHIMVDGASLKLIFKDLNDFYYQGFKEELITNYSELVEEALHNYNNNKEKCSKYYQEYFAGYQGMKDLPIDGINNEGVYKENNCYKFEISKDTTIKLRKWCKNNNMTTFEGLMTVYSVFLHTITGSCDVVFATPSRDYSDLNNSGIVSMLTNTLWIYSHVKEDENIQNYVSEYVRRVRELQNFKNVPVDFIYNLRNNNNNDNKNLTDTLIAYHSWKDIDSELFGMPIKAKPISPSDSMFLLNMQIFDNELFLEVEWEYAQDAFEKDTMKSLASIFMLTLESLINSNSNKYKSITELVVNCI